jgi:hypothetical protein
VSKYTQEGYVNRGWVEIFGLHVEGGKKGCRMLV